MWLEFYLAFYNIHRQMAPNLGITIYGSDEISSLGEHFGVGFEGSWHTLGSVSAVIWNLRPPLRRRMAFLLNFAPFFRVVKGGTHFLGAIYSNIFYEAYGTKWLIRLSSSLIGIYRVPRQVDRIPPTEKGYSPRGR